ncbi:proteasome inhibitor PI31 subunit-like [Centruroides sculpturatus]|uniref:proteasome inhibitor PI31 subunit-like n=1 Tax=Centruroides sculpturatus TaxID=218467 RepID=UPI000C6CA9EE|nr:proteasome inhibitor PI31 subunit-like [Centruroides sculpturatus]
MECLKEIFEKTKVQLTSATDALVFGIHCFIVCLKIRFVGIGKSRTPDCVQMDPWQLPEGWNADQQVYHLRYVDEEGFRYLLKVDYDKKFERLVVSWTDKEEKNIHLMEIDMPKYTGESWKQLETAYKNLDDFQSKITDMIKYAIKASREEKVSTSETLPVNVEKEKTQIITK